MELTRLRSATRTPRPAAYGPASYESGVGVNAREVALRRHVSFEVLTSLERRHVSHLTVRPDVEPSYYRVDHEDRSGDTDHNGSSDAVAQ